MEEPLLNRNSLHILHYRRRISHYTAGGAAVSLTAAPRSQPCSCAFQDMAAALGTASGWQRVIRFQMLGLSLKACHGCFWGRKKPYPSSGRAPAGQHAAMEAVVKHLSAGFSC